MRVVKKQVFVPIFIILIILAVIFIPKILNNYKDNVKEKGTLYIPFNASFQSVIDSITPYINDINSFVTVADNNNLSTSFKPGRYSMKPGMKNIEIVRIIQKGWQTPMMLTLSGNIRGKEKLAALLGRRLAADSIDFINYFNDSLVINKYGLKKETLITIFIPNSYEVYWTITPEQFMERMKKESDNFWNADRDNKAKELGMSREEISILASIVCEESNYKPEQPTIAGVYINRLKIGMKLDADPTVKYAWNDPSIKRILFRHLEIDSPYNTYKKTGLPPGPITIPNISGLDAVLNYERHKYLYFCASANLDGTHKFSETIKGHNRNAGEYQSAISKLASKK